MSYQIEWLGKGAYNKAYLVKSKKKTLGVFKVQDLAKPGLSSTIKSEITDRVKQEVVQQSYLKKDKEDKIKEQVAQEIESQEEINSETTNIDNNLDTASRSVRLWNEINPDFATAEVFEAEIDGVLQNGWLSPYIEGRQASDLEISQMLIDVYNRTGRIVVDAVGSGNVRVSKGKVVCVDVGLAILLDNEFGPLPKILSEAGKARRGSIVGVAQWRNIKDSFVKYFEKMSSSKPISISLIKALIFLKEYRPESRELTFLLEDRELVGYLAQAFDFQLKPSQAEEDYIEEVLKNFDAKVHKLPVSSTSPKEDVVPKKSESPEESKPLTYEEELRDLYAASKQYCNFLELRYAQTPKDPVINKRLSIMKSTVQKLEKGPSVQVVEEVKKDLKLHQDVFKKNPDSGFKTFLKALGVLAATIFGLGIGGYVAYQYFFKQAISEKKSNESSLELPEKNSPTPKG